MNDINNGFDFEDLENQLPDATGAQPENSVPAVENVQAPAVEAEEKPVNDASVFIGQKLSTYTAKEEQRKQRQTEAESFKEKYNLSRVGESINKNAEIRDGWMDVDRALLGERSTFYPEEWRFRIRPATVEAIRNWSTIDDENPNSVDDVFNEVIKSCVAIIDTEGNPIPWGNIRSWDRFFFLLLVREYTFVNGEVKVSYDEDCPNCDNAVKFELTSQTLMYEMPDPDIMHLFSKEDQSWLINPADYDVEGEEPIELYLPNLQKDANIKAWLIDRIRNKKKVDEIFVRFIPWMAKTINKDLTIAQRQIRDLEVRYKSWSAEMFGFMDEVIRNIIVMPETKLITTCPICGEEVTSQIQFPNGVNALFNVASGRKKFGKK